MAYDWEKQSATISWGILFSIKQCTNIVYLVDTTYPYLTLHISTISS